MWLAQNVFGVFRAVKIVYARNPPIPLLLSASLTASRSLNRFPARTTGLSTFCRWGRMKRQATSIT